MNNDVEEFKNIQIFKNYVFDGSARIKAPALHCDAFKNFHFFKFFKEKLIFKVR